MNKVYSAGGVTHNDTAWRCGGFETCLPVTAADCNTEDKDNNKKPN
jgi:hypothetical protein